LLIKLKAHGCKLNLLMYVIQLSCEIEQLEFPSLATSGANAARVEYRVSKHDSSMLSAVCVVAVQRSVAANQ